jgi:two-component system, OmpR family, heavy metal sensor histidine kinase CusS
MLFLARADQGERATGLVEVSLAAEVARTLEFLEIPFDEAQVRAVSRGDAFAPVNRSLFGRACTNLLMNAIQHCAPGDTVTVTISRQDGQVRIAVANPGQAIDPSRLDHLFDRFYRAEESRTNSRENHGLGLAIVKAIAEMHRGKVSVESANGVNMFAFSVDAPRVDVQAAQEVPAVPTIQAVREPVMTVERSSVVSGHGVTPEPAPAGR